MKASSDQIACASWYWSGGGRGAYVGKRVTSGPSELPSPLTVIAFTKSREYDRGPCVRFH